MPLVFRLFFAFKDTASPTITTVISVAANILLNYLFVALLAAGPLSDFFRQAFGLSATGDIGVLGLALAYSLANVLQFMLLAFLLYRKNAKLVRTAEIIGSFLKTAIAGVFMAIAVYLLIGVMPHVGLSQEMFSLAVSSLVAAAVYLVSTLLLKSPEIISIKQVLEKKWSKIN